MAKKPTHEEYASKLPGYLPPDDRPKCQKCGKQLQLTFMQRSPDNPERHYPFNGFPERAVLVRYGFDGDGLFCTKTCGYDYGCRAARNKRT